MLTAYLFWFGKTSFTKIDIIKSLLAPLIIITVFYLIELYLVTNILYHDIRTRPMSHYRATLLISQAGIPSFPSWPALYAAVFLPVILIYNKKYSVIASLITAIGGISLIIAGVHFMSDILTGWIIGLLAGIAGIKLFLRIPVKRYLIFPVAILVVSFFVLASEFSEMRKEKSSSISEKYITDEVKLDYSLMKGFSEKIKAARVEGEYASNGRITAVNVRVYDKIWSVNKIKYGVKTIIDELYGKNDKFSVITVEVYEGIEKKAVWLYTATVYRNDWVKGGAIPGLKGYGNKYYKLPMD